MADLMEGTYATGKGVVHPGCDHMPSAHGSDPSDSDDDPVFPIDPAILQNPVPHIPAATAVPAIPPAQATLITTAPAPGKRQAVDIFESTSVKWVWHKHKKSGSQAMEDMASPIDWLASAVAADATVPSPVPKRAAIHAIEDDGDLSDNEQIQVFKIICHDTGFADTILAIRRKDVTI